MLRTVLQLILLVLLLLTYFNDSFMAAVDSFNLLFTESSRPFKGCRDALLLLGIYYATKKSICILSDLSVGVRTYLWPKVSPTDLSQYGKWAVITGGSEGIGRGYAFALAERGLNIILIARDMRKLQSTGDEIRDRFDVEVEQISADFNEGPSIYRLIEQKLRGKEIGILINNVGVMPARPSPFLTNDSDYLQRILNVNMGTVLFMTQIVLEDMVSREKGVIVNISSIAGYNPLPLMSAYSASKAFVDYFSRSLQYEYKDKGIIVQSIMPSYICPSRENDFSAILTTPSILCPTANVFADSAVQTIGKNNRTPGYWPHGLIAWSISQIPQFIWYPLVWMIQEQLAC
ncbi:inactive hydroxysteroid dehydrogenase-like protein 1 [Tetranychus urticae]|uniref:Uncharacterized protein n=1 Tax=Tetranychus urticae TaxID=32264 RepID=T1KHZ3_TETUR|nr:inactive hydroxysteroid dehydrogenase-like protein 1 [Tetranychus urticae]